MKSKRVILDTNLWISFLISKKFAAFDWLVKQKRVKLIFSAELLKEFTDVANRPKFKKIFSKADIKGVLNSFDQYGELVNVTSTVELCRDKKDNFLLNLAIDSDADYLISGDNDLLVLGRVGVTEIVTFATFIGGMK